MNFSSIDTLFNLVLFIFWFEIFNQPRRSASVFNPLLAPLHRLGGSLTGAITALLPGVPSWLVALVCLSGFVVVRALIAPVSDGLWVLQFGYFLKWPPPPGSLAVSLGASALSFLMFLFQLWGIAVIYLHRAKPSGDSVGEDALHYLARPFSMVVPPLRGSTLLLTGMVIVYALSLLSRGAFLHDDAAPGLLSALFSPRNLVASMLLAIAAWAQVLLSLQHIVILLIIGSWVSMFTASEGIHYACHELMNLVIGPLRRLPLRIGPLDLTPIVFVILLQVAQVVLLQVVVRVYALLS